jgi:hypothetical protein
MVTCADGFVHANPFTASRETGRPHPLTDSIPGKRSTDEDRRSGEGDPDTSTGNASSIFETGLADRTGEELIGRERLTPYSATTSATGRHSRITAVMTRRAFDMPDPGATVRNVPTHQSGMS